MPRVPASEAWSLFKDYRAFAGWSFGLALTLMIVGALAEGIGILALVPLLSAAASGGFGLGPALTLLPELPPDRQFIAALALFLAAMLGRAGLLYARDRLLQRLSTEYEASMKLRATTRLAAMGWSKAARVGQAGMQALLLTDIPRCGIAMQQVQVALVAMTMLVVQFAIAALLSPTMALIALLLVVAGIGLSRPWFARASQSGMAISKVYDESTEAGFRLHAGLKSALAQGTAAAFLRECRISLDHLVGELVALARHQAAARAAGAAGAATAAVLMLLIGRQWLGLPFAILVTLLVLFARMSGPSQQLQQAIQSYLANAPAYSAVVARVGTLESPAADRVALEPLDWHEVRLEMVTCRHPDGGGIEEAALTFGAGEWLGLTGPSGAGKTTLVDVIAGLLDPQSGTLLVDNHPLVGERLERWRRSLSYVGQGDVLFDDSVRGNLLAGGAEADDRVLHAALATVGLSARLQSLPNGLDSTLGDRASNFSGGERQRLAIARALLRRPALLILDEATNALDEASEAELLANIRSLEPRPAALIIAHRAKTLSLCDRLIRVERGKLARA